jgi:hypothetical protein
VFFSLSAITSAYCFYTFKNCNIDGQNRFQEALEPVFLRQIRRCPIPVNYFASALERAKLSYLQPFTGEKDTFWPNLKEGQSRSQGVQITPAGANIRNQGKALEIPISNPKFQVPNSKFQVPSSKFQIPSSKFQSPRTNCISYLDLGA